MSIYGAGKEAKTYLSTVDQDRDESLKTMLDTLEEWTRPKSDEVAAFIQLRALNQGNKTLSTYIKEVRRVVDSVQFQLHGRMQGQADQKFHSRGSQSALKHISSVFQRAPFLL